MKTKIGLDLCGPICLPDGGGRCWLSTYSAIPACLQITYTLCSQDEVCVRSSSVWTVTVDTRYSDSKLTGTETLSPCVSGQVTGVLMAKVCPKARDVISRTS